MLTFVRAHLSAAVTPGIVPHHLFDFAFYLYVHAYVSSCHNHVFISFKCQWLKSEHCREKI